MMISSLGSEVNPSYLADSAAHRDCSVKPLLLLEWFLPPGALRTLRFAKAQQGGTNHLWK
jgi:hypothetical protein